MGFIERLRQQKEAAWRQQQQERERLAGLDRERWKHEDEERRRHEQQKFQARQFRDESEIQHLVKQFRDLLPSGIPGIQFYINDSLRLSSVPTDVITTPRVELANRDVDSAFDLASWDPGGVNKARHGFKNLGNLIIAETCPDGTIQFHGAGHLGSSTIRLDSWRHNKSVLESALEKAYLNPIKYSWEYYVGRTEGSGPCLPGNSRISTPNGFVLIKDLRVGDFVWTVDRFGHRVQTIIVNKTKRIVSKNHKLAHIIG